MKQLLLSLLMGYLCPIYLFSQPFLAGQINEDLLKGRVKQIEEFMARFNCEEDWEGNSIADSNDSTLRSKYLHTLFDYSLFKEENGKLTAMAEQFIAEVVNKGYRIHYTDTTWLAKVRCKAKLCGTPTALTFYLRIQQVAPYEYRWVVAGAESPLFQNTADSIPPLKISPVEHELGFTGLLSLTSPKLQVTLIEDISYQFHNIPGYSFSIERIERKDSYNTGWLITSLTIR